MIKYFHLVFSLVPFMILGQKTNENKKVKQKSDFIVLPNIAYAPETSLVLGVAGFYNNVWGDVSEQNKLSSHSFYGQYTLEKQISFGIRSDSWFANNKYHIVGSWDYNKYPFDYYTIHKHSDAMPESYTSKYFNAFFGVERELVGNLYMGFLVETRIENVIEVEKDKELAKKDILGIDKYSVFGIAPTITYDTRDNVWCPTKGDFHQIKIKHFNKALSNVESFTIYDFDFRKYFTVNKYEHILALNLAYQFTDNKNIPFQMLPGVGKEKIQRGYYEGRYRSTNRIVFKSEYRFPVYKKFKVATFGSLSTVDNSFINLFKSKVNPAIGLGLRYQLTDSGMNIRIDFAYGGAISPYINVGEAF